MMKSPAWNDAARLLMELRKELEEIQSDIQLELGLRPETAVGDPLFALGAKLQTAQALLDDLGSMLRELT
jgi:hypothetical protein